MFGGQSVSPQLRPRCEKRDLAYPRPHQDRNSCIPLPSVPESARRAWPNDRQALISPYQARYRIGPLAVNSPDIRQRPFASPLPTRTMPGDGKTKGGRPSRGARDSCAIGAAHSYHTKDRCSGERGRRTWTCSHTRRPYAGAIRLRPVSPCVRPGTHALASVL